MGAQSHVRISFDTPESTMDITGTGVMRVLEAIRKTSPQTKFLQASSSEMYGNSVGGAKISQNEKTAFNPKIAVWHSEGYGILYNGSLP